MARERTGAIRYLSKRRLYEVRITYTDDQGKRHDLRRQAPTISAAKEALKKLKQSLESHGPNIIDGERLSFKQLAEYYEGRKLQPPTYKGETRIAGLRSWKIQRLFLRALVAHFGVKRIRSITHSDIEDYKAKRFRTPVKQARRNAQGKVVEVAVRERSVANVNRELSLLRAILNFARRSGWLIRNPFDMGDSLISTADETRRERILRPDEEARLLAVCEGPRAHIRALVICALDTAMRRGEMFKLRWSDVDFDAGLLRIRKTTTKTWEARAIGMTARLRLELEGLRKAAPPGDGSVFGVNSIKHSFSTALRLAAIVDLRLHDLRHTATTRMIEAGMPPMKVMKVTGHKQMATFLRYLNIDDNSARDAAALLDEYHEETRARSEFIN